MAARDRLRRVQRDADKYGMYASFPLGREVSIVSTRSSNRGRRREGHFFGGHDLFTPVPTSVEVFSVPL